MLLRVHSRRLVSPLTSLSRTASLLLLHDQSHNDHLTCSPPLSRAVLMNRHLVWGTDPFIFSLPRHYALSISLLLNLHNFSYETHVCFMISPGFRAVVLWQLFSKYSSFFTLVYHCTSEADSDVNSWKKTYYRNPKMPFATLPPPSLFENTTPLGLPFFSLERNINRHCYENHAQRHNFPPWAVIAREPANVVPSFLAQWAAQRPVGSDLGLCVIFLFNNIYSRGDFYN